MLASICGKALRPTEVKDAAQLKSTEVILTILFPCSEKEIKHDSYLVPFTTYELGLLHKQKGDINTAIAVIENAK